MTIHNVPKRSKSKTADLQIAREVSAARKVAGLTYMVSSHAVDEQARRLMAFIPRDTRSLTGRVCGDPLPGRSALDRQHREA